jgi:hypothetical protein
MPYLIAKENDQYCVHKQNADGSAGAKVKCHPTRKEAKDHMDALYVAMDKENALKATSYKAITDAPELRGKDERSCSSCQFYKWLPQPPMDGMIEGGGSRVEVWPSSRGICQKFDFEASGDFVCDDWAKFTPEPMEVSIQKAASIKAVGDWELDICAIPFNTKDSDRQWFDENTDIMAEQFPTPVVIYQHSIKQGAKGFEDKPVVIGDTVPGSLKKESDGWHLRVILNKTLEKAKNVMEAAKKKLVAVSSGSIDHLARLEVAGKMIPYDKGIPGRIAVWPFGEISLWDMGGGNLSPANHTAYALPAMKAIYNLAGLTFPTISPESPGHAGDAGEASQRAGMKAEAQARSRQFLRQRALEILIDEQGETP